MRSAGKKERQKEIMRLREYGAAACELAASSAVCADPECGRENETERYRTKCDTSPGKQLTRRERWFEVKTFGSANRTRTRNARRADVPLGVSAGDVFLKTASAAFRALRRDCGQDTV
jgi:hypothetical protein